MNTNFKGIYTALLTPFDKDDKLNKSALEKLVEYNIEKGVDGFYVCGSTAEAFLLTDDERNEIYEIVSKVNNGRVKLIAHVGAVSTRQAIAFADTAVKYNYDAISAVAPFYYKFGFDKIKKHYYDIVNAVDLPMLIYNFPNFSGVNLSVDEVAQFFCDDRFIGIKHTSSDYFAMERFKTCFADKYVFNGFDEMFLSGLSMGADGGIGSTYNFMAEKFIRMLKLFEDGNIKEAQEIQKEVNRIVEALCKVGVMEGEKEVMNQLGFDFGHARAPFGLLTEEQKIFLRENITERL